MAELATAGLQQLLQGYERTLLTDAFRERIRSREQEGHFPFSVQNIYRVLLAVAPSFHDAFATAAGVLDFGDDALQEQLGSPARAFRSFHVVAVGALRRDALDPHGRELLKRIGAGFAARANGSSAIPAEQADALDRAMDAATVDPLTAARAAVFLREYVDSLFLGQHDHGYTAYEPLVEDDRDLVLREFTRLPAGILGFESVRVGTRYRPGACRDSSYDPMRGDVERLPHPSALTGAAVLAGDEAAPLDGDGIGVLVDAVAGDLRRLQAERRNLESVRGEQLVAEWFLAPAAAVLATAGISADPWREAAAEAVEAAHAVAPPPSYTDLYLDQLAAAVATLQAPR
jgi:hypothetical protein